MSTELHATQWPSTRTVRTVVPLVSVAYSWSTVEWPGHAGKANLRRSTCILLPLWPWGIQILEKSIFFSLSPDLPQKGTSPLNQLGSHLHHHHCAQLALQQQQRQQRLVESEQDAEEEREREEGERERSVGVGEAACAVVWCGVRCNAGQRRAVCVEQRRSESTRKVGGERCRTAMETLVGQVELRMRR